MEINKDDTSTQPSIFKNLNAFQLNKQMPLNRFNEENYHSDVTTVLDDSDMENHSTSFSTKLFGKKRKKQYAIITESSNKKKKQTSKWPENVEEVFTEALQLIPKKAVKEIKICGSIYGRNQYICFYIKHKTGVVRTAKQVSSHIQALSKKDEFIKDLLITGPGETKEICEKFVKIFTAILNQLSTKSSNLTHHKSQQNMHTNYLLKSSFNEISDSVLFTRNKNSIKFLMKKFEMAYVNFKLINESHLFSTIDSTCINNEISEIRISKNDLMDKFPLLAKIILSSTTIQFSTHMNLGVPIIVGNISMTLPPWNSDLLTGCYNLNTKVSLSTLPKEDRNYGILTIISSNNYIIQEDFEMIDLVSNKSKTEIIFNVKIGTEYWEKYILNKQKEAIYNGTHNIRSSETTYKMEINPIKIQQFVVYRNHLEQSVSIKTINPYNIRSIFIWNFSKVVNQSEAITSIYKISSIYDLEATPIRKTINTQEHNKSTPFLLQSFYSNDGKKLVSPLSAIAEKQSRYIKSTQNNSSCISPPISSYKGSPLVTRNINQQFLNSPNESFQIPNSILITPPPCVFKKFRSEIVNPVDVQDNNRFNRSNQDIHDVFSSDFIDNNIINSSFTTMEDTGIETSFIRTAGQNIHQTNIVNETDLNELFLNNSVDENNDKCLPITSSDPIHHEINNFFESLNTPDVNNPS
jgi:hypothetical protein